MNARRVSPGTTDTNTPAGIMTQWSLFDPASHPVVVLDSDDRLAYANATAQACFADQLASLPHVTHGQRVELGGAWYQCNVFASDGHRVCQFTEVTELKQALLRLRRSEQLMVDTQGVAHLGTWQWDVSMPTATWSDELYRIYGLSRDAYTPSYEQYLTLVHPDDRQRVMDATNKVFHEHIPYSHDERIYRPDGSLRHLHTWAHPLLDEHGKLTHLIGVCQDITDRVAAEDAVRELNQELERRVADRTATIERTMRDLEAFNAFISHDLRTPLMTIQLGADYLLGTASTAEAATIETVKRIKRAAGRAAELLNDLLGLARVGASVMQTTDVDLSKMADEVLSGLRRAEPARRVKTTVTPHLSCHADPGLLRAALENLVGNAWKYTSKTTDACIEIGRLEGQPVFFVRDNGAGFDPAQAERLFEVFERLHSPEEFEGTGVGLAVVKRIVERQGGRVWAEAEPDAGATFYFELPTRFSEPGRVGESTAAGTIR